MPEILIFFQQTATFTSITS